MWKELHQLAKPERLYQLCGRLLPWFALASAAVLLLAWVWGFGYAPADYQQGDSFRIMYIHVPAAMWSMGIYSAMAVAAFTGLVWQMKMADLVSAAMAPIGAVFTFIALVTGSAWGKPMWGTWWIWDARLTSELVAAVFISGRDCAVSGLRRSSHGRAGRRRAHFGRGDQSAHHSFLCAVVEYLTSGIVRVAATGDRAADAHAAALGHPG